MKKNYLLLFCFFLTAGLYAQDTLDLASSKEPQNITASKSQEIKDFRLYPNPVVNGKLFISTLSNGEKTIQIFDILGKQVVSTKLAGKELDISNLHPGVYILKAMEEGKTATRKLVIK